MSPVLWVGLVVSPLWVGSVVVVGCVIYKLFGRHMIVSQTVPPKLTITHRLADVEYEIVYEKKGPRGLHCPVEGCFRRVETIVDLEHHHAQRHHMTKEDKRKARYQKQKQNNWFCLCCLQTFHSERTKDAHMETKSHRARENYQMGSGCDVCHKAARDLEAHCLTPGHHFSVKREEFVRQQFGSRAKSARSAV